MRGRAYALQVAVAIDHYALENDNPVRAPVVRRVCNWTVGSVSGRREPL